jgi:hypothetical protein
MVFFGLAAIWFIALAVADVSGVRQRVVDGYHSVMMAAMVWMFAVMHNGPSIGHGSHSHHHDAHASAMHMASTIEASSMQLTPRISEPVWVSAINWIAALGFVIATVYWLRRFVPERPPPDPLSHDVSLARPELLCQVCAIAGTAVMFASML